MFIYLFLTNLPATGLGPLHSHTVVKMSFLYLYVFHSPRNCCFHTFWFCSFLSLWLEFPSLSLVWLKNKQTNQDLAQCLLWLLQTQLRAPLCVPIQAVTCWWIVCLLFLWTVCIVSSLRAGTWVFHLSVSQCLVKQNKGCGFPSFTISLREPFHCRIGGYLCAPPILEFRLFRDEGDTLRPCS